MYWNPDIPKAWVHFCQRILLESDIHKPWKNSASSNREVGIYLHQSELRFSDIHVKSSKLTVNSCIIFIQSSGAVRLTLLVCWPAVFSFLCNPTRLWLAAFYKTGCKLLCETNKMASVVWYVTRMHGISFGSFVQWFIQIGSCLHIMSKYRLMTHELRSTETGKA